MFNLKYFLFAKPSAVKKLKARQVRFVLVVSNHVTIRPRFCLLFKNSYKREQLLLRVSVTFSFPAVIEHFYVLFGNKKVG